ncbi:dUTP diphosphatase [Bacillus sp. JJ722]|uniref:dUTP diphosphatase n=1 Tax=Bacillus sp. JJ722 TaxID=3122973 RepID=UPI003000F014
MNLEKMFETQKVLRERIDYNEKDRFEKLVLALLVELGECANEWRGFKFWSKDQKPRNFIQHLCPTCKGTGNESFSVFGEDDFEPCVDCDATGILGESNPLLEEYVDCLHFVLEIGIELNLENGIRKTKYKLESIDKQFVELLNNVCILNSSVRYEDEEIEADFEEVWSSFLGLSEMLGFSEEQIEQAYYDKNKINHERQDVGY